MKDYEQAFLRHCKKCGLVYADTIPEDRDLEEHYDDYSRDDYLSPITIKRYNEILDSFESFRKENRLLDVGCGMGFFGEQGVKKGWEVHGSEFSDKAVEIGSKKGLVVKKGDLLDITFENQFDVISAFEVIEHVTDPRGFIEKCHSLIRPGGLLYLTTPNFSSLNSRVLKSNWNVVSYPEHLNYFNRSSLENLGKQIGFSVIKSVTDGVSPGRLLRSLQGKDMDFSDRNNPDEKLRRSVESNIILRGLKSGVNSLLNKSGLGENLKVSFIKL